MWGIYVLLFIFGIMAIYVGAKKGRDLLFVVGVAFVLSTIGTYAGVLIFGNRIF